MIDVMVVDDQILIREGIKTVVDAHPHMRIIYEASDGIEAMQILHEAVRTDTLPDVVLMDIRMPGIDGVEATRRIRDQIGADRPTIVILTTFERDEYVLSAFALAPTGSSAKAPTHAN